MNKLYKKLAGEVLGSWILSLFGLMSIAVAVTTGAYGLFQSSLLFGIAVALAIFAVGGISGAHLNPAVTVALAFFKNFPKREIIPYILAQVSGWFLGAVTLHFLYGNTITAYEVANKIVRGEAGSELSAMIYNCYAPHPALMLAMKWGVDVIPLWLAIVAETFATSLLCLTVLLLTDKENPAGPKIGAIPLLPIVVGSTVALVMAVEAPLTMAAINPARDLGPRLLTWFAGWGSISMPGTTNSPFWVYWVGPLSGAFLSGAIYKFIRILHPRTVHAPNTQLAERLTARPSLNSHWEIDKP